MSLDAKQIVSMLATRHSKDLFVPECKDGPTQTRAHRRLDAWVLVRTWSPITTLGYEIKVSRSDWLGDQKIADYMPLCHLLYIVAPKGVVRREELPSSVGLLEPVGDGGRLQIRHKAARREIVLPAELMTYVLMCRSKITREDVGFGENGRNWRVEELQNWVAGKSERQQLSYAVSGKIRQRFEEQEARLRDLQRQNEELERIRTRVRELGFDEATPVTSWQVQKKLEEFNRTVDNWTLQQMRQTAQRLEEMATKLESMKGTNGA